MHLKLRYFRKYANANYNIVFGMTDCCSNCLKTKEQLKITTSSFIRQKLRTEHRVCVMKAKAFLKLLRDPKPKTFHLTARKTWRCLSFFFSQQINRNNFTVVSEKKNKIHIFRGLCLLL